jgi:hypothetical protein
MTISDSFFTASGSSPPVDAQPLPPELVEALATLLADALVADIRQYPNLAEVQTNQESTVESPSGLHRRLDEVADPHSTWWHTLPHRVNRGQRRRKRGASHGPYWHRRAQEGKPALHPG